MLLLKNGDLAFLELDVGHKPLRPKPGSRRYKALGDLYALALGLDLRLELRDLSSETFDKGGKTIPLGVGSLFLGRNLPREQVFLRIQRTQHHRVDVVTIAGNLVRLHRQKRLSILNLIAFPDVNLFYCSLLRSKNLRRAQRWRKISNHCLFSSVLTDEKKTDDQGNSRTDEPAQYFC